MTDQAQLRQQLLASEASGETMPDYSEAPRAQYPPQNFLPQNYLPQNYLPQNYLPQNYLRPVAQGSYGYSNHDLMTPVNVAAVPPSSRKASMTSSLGVQKLFRRRGTGAAFDEEMGADIGDIAGGDMSFSDITHVRGTGGRYNVFLTMLSDSSAPIIPVIGGGIGAPSKNMTNIQYRKQMNHQKKLILANSSRAMSLAGGNPMVNSNAGQDYPRSMSFNNRAMSLEQTHGGPRTMSLQAGMNRPRPGAGPMPPQMGGRGPMPGNPMYGPGNPNIGPGGPRAMSLRTQNLPPQHMRGPGPGGRLNSLNGTPPVGPRTQSFTGSNPNLNQRGNHPNGYGPQYNGYIQGRPGQQPYYPNQQTPNQQIPNQHGQQFSSQQYPPSIGSNPHLDPLSSRSQNADHAMSSDSFMNVVEEEAEYEKSQLDPGKTGTFNFSESQAELNNLSDQDHVYKLDDNDVPPLSRKSTIKKSDSMRVRRLNLFNKGHEDVKEVENSHAEKDDPSFNLSRTDNPLSKKLMLQLDDHESGQHRLEQTNKPKSLGALAPDTGDTFYTSPEFFTPVKDPLTANGDDNHISPVKPTKKSIKLNSLAENTIYSKFRSLSQARSSEEIHYKGPLFDKSETESQDSVYSSMTPKLSDSFNPLVSPSSYHPSPIHDGNASKSEFDFSTPEHQFQSSADEGKRTNVEDEKPPALPSKNETNNNVIQNNISTEKLPQVEFEAPEIKSKEEPSQNTDDMVDAILHRRTSTLSRSGSELKLQGLLPAGGLITVQQPISINDTDKFDQEKELPKVRGVLLSSKSKSFIKRLSRSTSKRNIADDADAEYYSGTPRLRVSSTVSLQDNSVKKQLVFTKDELAIMSCNNDLQNELQFVTSELALSIKRELALEFQVRTGTKDHAFDDTEHQKEMIEKSKTIADLQEKLNNERRLRFISEEHALLSEHGQTPSALKLDYEKNELYKQLLAKNDLVNQLQDKLDELESSGNRKYDDDLLQKYNELTTENSTLREKVESLRIAGESQVLAESATSESHEYEQAQIFSLRTQRDELREMITKLTSSQSVELKSAHDRVRTLEEKLRKVNMINDKLSKKGERPENSGGLGYGSGGKLQGFDVVTPRTSVMGSK